MDVHVTLEGRGDLAGQIYRQVRVAVLDGRLRAGERLPPTRELARQLGVSRTTASLAYDRLAGEGFVESRTGSGTYVSSGAAPGASAAPRAAAGGALRPHSGWDRVWAVPASVVRAGDPGGRRAGHTGGTRRDTEPEYDFRAGIPDARLFPFESWRRLVTRELRRTATGSAMYGEPAGHPDLRAAIARRLAVARGVVTGADDVVVTNGAQQALDLLGRVLLSPGDRVAVEEPGYPPPRLLFRSLGADVRPIPVDDEGLVVDAIPDGTRLVYVSPAHQFPMGMPMSLPRRMALLSWADRAGAAVVEDDYDSEFRFGGRPLETLRSLDPAGRVVYVGTFSKTMLPTLRLGFLVAPPSLREALRAAKYVTDWHTTVPTQAALARFIDEGGFARHIRRTRTEYRARYERIVDTLAGTDGSMVPVPSVTGMHLSAVLPGHAPADVAAAVRRAAASGVAVYPLTHFHAGPPAQAGLVLGYGAIPLARIDPGLARLTDALRSGAE